MSDVFFWKPDPLVLEIVRSLELLLLAALVPRVDCSHVHLGGKIIII